MKKKKNSKNQKPELLCPAGNWISLRAAISSGADAIFFGTKELNMRITTNNFELKDLKKITKICKQEQKKQNKKQVKTYLTLNTLIYDSELKKAENIIKKAKDAKIDAIIISDIALIKFCKKHKINFHISTQMSVSNYETFKTLSKQGAKAIVLARELTLDQIKKIINKTKKDKIKTKVETFIHGAMCVSVSGRCFLSQFHFNKSANRGDCLQPCRRKYDSYKIIDPEEKNKLKLNNNYILSPKDMCTIPIIEKLIESKIQIFKIEGRNKSPEYVKNVTKAYRELIDFYFDNKSQINSTKKETKKKYTQIFENQKKQALKKVKQVYNRGFSQGFFMGKPINQWTDSYGTKATKKKIFIGIVKNYFNKPKIAEIIIQTKEIKTNDHIMIQGPTTGIIEFNIDEIRKNNKSILTAKKKDLITVPTPIKVRKNDKVYIIKNRK